MHDGGTETIMLRAETHKIPVKKKKVLNRAMPFPPTLPWGYLQKARMEGEGVLIGYEDFSNRKICRPYCSRERVMLWITMLNKHFEQGKFKVGLRMNRKKSQVKFNNRIQIQQIQAIHTEQQIQRKWIKATKYSRQTYIYITIYLAILPKESSTSAFSPSYPLNQEHGL